MRDDFFSEAVLILETIVKSRNGYYSRRDGWESNKRRSFKAANAHAPQRIYAVRRKVLPCNRVKERRAL